MADTFGVAVSNKFAFLDEDAPSPQPAAAKKEKAEKKDVKPKKQESRKDTKPRDNKERNGRNDGTSRPRGGGRGGRGGRGGARGGKREFDRHVPGTGRRETQKRDGSGKYNWGAEGEQDENERPRRNRDNQRRNNDQQTEKPAAEATPAVEGETAPEGEAAPAAEAAAPEEPVEQEPEQLTYAEYRESQKAKAPEEDSTVVRKVQNDDSQFKAAATFEKVEDDEGKEYELGMGGKKPKKGKKKAATNKVNIDEFMKDSNQRRGGGRGRGRGGGPRGGGRGNRGARLTMDDSNFPALG